MIIQGGNKEMSIKINKLEIENVKRVKSSKKNLLQMD